jgi:ABC-2 type transport system ATP-binding protein
MNNMQLLHITGLTKRYGEFTALAGLDLSVAEGEIFAFLGPNGAGKTTTIKLLMGLLIPSAGTAVVDGMDCFEDRVEIKRKIGYVPDEPIFPDYLRGVDLLRFVGGMHGLATHDIEAITLPLLKRLDLTDAVNDYAVNYSRGMKKKLGLITALLHSPKLLILDEPTNGLDPVVTRQVIDILRECSETGTAVFYSTHLLDQAERFCDRIGILNKGRLEAVGTTLELQESFDECNTLEDLFFAITKGETTDAEQDAATGELPADDTSPSSDPPEREV